MFRCQCFIAFRIIRLLHKRFLGSSKPIDLDLIVTHRFFVYTCEYEFNIY